MLFHYMMAFLVASLIGLAVFAILLFLCAFGVLEAALLGGSSFVFAFIMLLLLIGRAMSSAIEKALNTISHTASVAEEGRTLVRKTSAHVLAERIDRLLTSQRAELDKLKRSEAFRAEFTADVSHELKTPLFAAQGFIHTLIDGAIDDEGVRVKFLKKAAKNLDHLGALVQDLLTLSQIETGGVTMKIEYIDLYTLCLEAVEQFEQRGFRRRFAVHPLPDGSLPVVRADGLRIRQVINNLISNAVNYTDPHGQVDIRFDMSEDYVTTSVVDTGIGIAEEHLSQIFRRFYRIDKSRSKERGGTGLGLAIVKHILEQHGSRIEVASKLGEGSTFYFSLRRAASRTALTR